MAAQNNTQFVCTECGADYRKWQGQCPACGGWNCISEFRTGVKKNTNKNSTVRNSQQGFAGKTSEIQSLSTIDVAKIPRILTGYKEFDRVLGGGLVPGSAILVGGSPGAGKSTLLLQTVCRLSKDLSVLYITGEESLQQVALRAQRLGLQSSSIQLLSETQLENILEHLNTLKPDVVVIDSIQVIFSEAISSAPGSVSQVRDCAAELTRYAKTNNTVLFLVGHITKEGHIAGPKVLEHMIDCSLMLEGDADGRYRSLRSHKNRFGSVNELGIFAMMDQGMKEVKNPSAIFLQRIDEQAPGTLVTAIWEGTRPILLELQALVDDNPYGNPRRIAVGVDGQRLLMLLAILHRHGGIQVNDQDVFINLVGGIRSQETSMDLAVLLAITASFRGKELSRDLIVFGEVGLTGEIRPVQSGQQRIQEALKHGFKRAIVPFGNKPKDSDKNIIGVKTLKQALEVLF